NLASKYHNYHHTASCTPICTPEYTKAAQNRADVLTNSQINWNRLYQQNSSTGYSVNALYADVMQDNQLTANTLFNTQISNVVGFNAGLTYRNLRSENYQEMIDLLG